MSELDTLLLSPHTRSVLTETRALIRVALENVAHLRDSESLPEDSATEIGSGLLNGSGAITELLGDGEDGA